MNTILVVDDDDSIRSIIEETLTDEGYSVRGEASGADALAWLDQHPIAVVLCDQMMPGMSGDALCRQISSTPQWQTVRVVMMSGASETVFQGTCCYDGFLAKPFHLHQLSAAVTSALLITH